METALRPGPDTVASRRPDRRWLRQLARLLATRRCARRTYFWLLDEDPYWPYVGRSDEVLVINDPAT